MLSCQNSSVCAIVWILNVLDWKKEIDKIDNASSHKKSYNWEKAGSHVAHWESSKPLASLKKAHRTWIKEENDVKTWTKCQKYITKYFEWKKYLIRDFIKGFSSLGLESFFFNMQTGNWVYLYLFRDAFSILFLRAGNCPYLKGNLCISGPKQTFYHVFLHIYCTQLIFERKLCW